MRANLKIKSIQELVDGLSELLIVHSEGAEGMLRVVATDNDIPTVTLEVGGPHVFDRKGIEECVTSIQSLMQHLKLTRKFTFFPKPRPSLNRSEWLRSDYSGMFFSNIKWA